MHKLWVYYGYVITNHCPVCERSLSNKRKFCSVECKSESQKKRVELECAGCGKHFRIWPYLRKKSNYCSVSCYHYYTRKKAVKCCPVCGISFQVKDYLIRKGFGIYCSQKCRYEILRKSLTCFHCKKEFIRAVSLSIKYPRAFCSNKCCDDSKRDYVSISCRNCQRKISIPQSIINRGKGGFCSWYCYTRFKGETSIEKLVKDQLKKVKIPFQQEVKIGQYHADFMIEHTNVLIECDGDYWHSLPEAIIKDQKRDSFLHKQGYQVVRLTERDIKNTKGCCVIDILRNFHQSPLSV